MSRSTTVAPKKENTAVVVVDIDKALPANKAELVKQEVISYCQALDKMEPEYKALVEGESQVYSAKAARQAGALRKKYVKLRGSNGSEGTRKVLKDDSLLEGRVIDNVFGKVRDAAKDREEQLREIEEYVEREQKRIEEELQMDRFRELQDYILVEDELNDKLGLMVEERWEEYFLEIRNAFKANEEKLAKEKLANDRMNEAAPYTLMIEDYNAINWAELKEKRFKEILQGAKDKWEAQEKERIEHESKVAELRAKADEVERLRNELELRYRKRVGLLTGTSLQEDGVYYKGKLLLSNTKIKNTEEEPFAKFLFNHLEEYTKDQEQERVRKEGELELIRKQEAEKAKLESVRLQGIQKKKEEDERLQAEEERLMALKHKEVNSTDADKFMEYAEAWGELEFPVCTSKKGGEMRVTLAAMMTRGIQWIKDNAEKL